MTSAPHPPLRGKTSQTTRRGQARASAILAQAYDIFVREGYGGFSARSVAIASGVTLSTLQHYYPSKADLLQALWYFVLERYQAALDKLLDGMPDASRLERFMAAMDLFLSMARDPDTVRGLVQLWAAAAVDPVAAGTLQKIQAIERKAVHQLMRGINAGLAEEVCEARAALIVAQIEGLVMQRAGNQPLPPALEAAMDQAARASFYHLANSD
jgi:AcrR family transcriptional regulator